MQTEVTMFTTSIDYCNYQPFADRAAHVLSSGNDHPTIKDEIRLFFRVLRAATRDSVLVLRSSWGHVNADILAGAIIGLWPRRYRPIVVLTGCMWEPESGFRHLVERVVVKLLDRAVCLYAVQSSEELTIFPETWHISADKTRLCPYFYTFTDQELNSEPVTDGGYVFAGGNSHREYAPLLVAARQLPDIPFILATDRLEGTALPPNVTAASVPHQEFVRLMRGATAVVVPMRTGMRRAVGQQTYLNAMRLGKLTIISDILGVHDHVEDRRTALIVGGSVDEYTKALRWVFDPENKDAVAQIRENGRSAVRETFTFDKHAARLVEIIEEAAHDAGC